MIQNQDRSWWFGASDTSYIVGNWTTQSFVKWWQEKIGIGYAPKFQNKYTLAGTYYEHAILDMLVGVEKDRQIHMPNIRLRVNYDGLVGQAVKEVKTFKADKEFKVTKAYWRQAQVEMFAIDSRDLEIIAYPLTEEHYRNYFIPIEANLIKRFPIKYDDDFINDEYLPKIKYLADCMKVGSFPRLEEFNEKVMEHLH